MPKMPNAGLPRPFLRPSAQPVHLDRTGGNCSVRTVKPADISESQTRWLNDPVVRAGLNVSGPAMNVDGLRRYVAAFDNINRNLIGVWTGEGVLAGFVMLEIDQRHKRGSVHTIIGDKQNRRLGLAAEAVRLVAWHCFLERKLGKLTFEPLANNEAAVAACRAGRLRQEGHLVAHRLNERTGERLDQLVFGLTDEEFKSRMLAYETLPPYAGPGIAPTFVAERVQAFARERAGTR
jgi:RimJ/RimL family protein N-acetyltransferase